MIQLALSLKTRLCVYMYLPYVGVYITTNVHSCFHGKLKALRLWVLSTMIIWEGKGITCPKFFNLGKKKHNYVWKAYQLYVYKYTYIPLIWNIHILTHLLWTLYLCIIYSPSLEAVFSSFDSGLWWLSSNKLKWIFLKGSDSIPIKWHFRIPVLLLVTLV